MKTVTELKSAINSALEIMVNSTQDYCASEEQAIYILRNTLEENTEVDDLTAQHLSNAIHDAISCIKKAFTIPNSNHSPLFDCISANGVIKSSLRNLVKDGLIEYEEIYEVLDETSKVVNILRDVVYNPINTL